MGQIVSYLLRPRPDLKEVLDQYQRSLGLSRPLVGMHVRRTDKIGTGVLSAKAVPIAKYIRRAQAFWRSTRLEAGIENNVWQEQKVYVASDDPRAKHSRIIKTSTQAPLIKLVSPEVLR